MNSIDHQLLPGRHPTISIFATPDDAADAVAAFMLARVLRKPEAVLGLATGQTPRRVYARLIEAVVHGQASFSSITTFNLDEYCGLSAQHPDSFAAYMHRELFSRTDFPPAQINLIDGAASDEGVEAQRYGGLLQNIGGVDLQLLGLGSNGHIGFNEPGSGIASRVRVVDLSTETLAANKPTLIASDSVPPRAITMGIADILDAREIVMLATGAAKANAVYRCLEQPPTDDCPGSHLAGHGNVHWFLDSAAAALLRA
jgi:glucosamine-6-phosphate deaminase